MTTRRGFLGMLAACLAAPVALAKACIPRRFVRRDEWQTLEIVNVKHEQWPQVTFRMRWRPVEGGIEIDHFRIVQGEIVDSVTISKNFETFEQFDLLSLDPIMVTR